MFPTDKFVVISNGSRYPRVSSGKRGRPPNRDKWPAHIKEEFELEVQKYNERWPPKGSPRKDRPKRLKGDKACKFVQVQELPRVPRRPKVTLPRSDPDSQDGVDFTEHDAGTSCPQSEVLQLECCLICGVDQTATPTTISVETFAYICDKLKLSFPLGRQRPNLCAPCALLCKDLGPIYSRMQGLIILVDKKIEQLLERKDIKEQNDLVRKQPEESESTLPDLVGVKIQKEQIIEIVDIDSDIETEENLTQESDDDDCCIIERV